MAEHQVMSSVQSHNSHLYDLVSQPPQTRTGAIHAYGSSSRASATPPQSTGVLVSGLVSSESLPWFPPVGHSARRRLSSRGSLGPRFPTFLGTMRRYDCHRVPLGLLRLSLASRYLACFRAFVVSLAGSCPGGSPANTPGPLVTRSPSPGMSSRRQMALPSSRVPPLKTCPALRPRWCPAHSPKRTQDCCLPVRAHRRLPTTIPISGLHHAACLLATPGFVRPLTGRHAGSLLTCWLDVSQVGLEPSGSAPTEEQQPISWVFTHSQGFGLTLARARRGSAGTPPHRDADTGVVLPARPSTIPCSSPAPTYWITSSARSRSVGGKVIPSTWAVFRLRTSSNLVGCSTGRSAGFTPFKMRST